MDNNQAGFDVFFLYDSQSVLEFSINTDRLTSDNGKDKTISTEWVPWYSTSKNLEPDNIVRLLTQNNINPPLLDTKRDFIIGSGVKLYESKFTDGKIEKHLLDPKKYTAIADFLEANRIDIVFGQLCKDLLWFGNFFAGLTYKGQGRKIGIDKIYHLDATTVRAAKMESGEIPAYFVCDEWTLPRWDADKPKEGNVTRLKSYNRAEPKKSQPHAVWHGKEYMAGFPYYSLPSWYGAKTWIMLANTIPVWHLAGIKNGYHIKYHIKIPLAYFDKFPPELREQKKVDLRNEMNKWLSGAENVGKAFVSFKTQMGVEAVDWDIVPIDAALHDEAFTQLFEQSNLAMTSAHSMHPSIAGVQLPGKLGNASEQRIAHDIYVALKTPNIRRILLELLYEAKKVNGWDKNVEFGFENIQPTTLDVNPTGTQSIMN
jgi:hypothetical protein